MRPRSPLSPFTGACTSRRTLVQVLIVIAATVLLIAGGVAAVVTTRTHPDTRSEAGMSGTTGMTGTDSMSGMAGEAGVSGGGGYRVCEREGVGEASMPVIAPTITGRGRAGVPVLREATPAVRVPLVHCWPHTPTGALGAATGFLLQLADLSDDTGEVARALVTRSSQSLIDTIPQGGQKTQVSVHGYAVTEAGEDRMIVALAVSTPESSRLIAWPLTLVWEEGDWRVELPSTGRWNIEPIPDLVSAQLTAWEVGE